MSDTSDTGPVGWPAWAAAALPSAFTFMASCAVLLADGPSRAMDSVREAGAGFYLVTLLAMLAVLVCSVLLFLAARGKAVPSAVTLFCASLPWLAGVGASRWGASRLAAALAYADPASRMSMVARGVAKACLARGHGALLGAALFAAAALGLGLAILGTRRDHGSGRGSALAVATLAALTLAVLATGSSLAQRSLWTSLAAMGAADPPSRLVFAARAAEEVRTFSSASLYAGLMALLMTLAFTGWAAWRLRPTVGRVAGGAAVALALSMGFALPHLPAVAVEGIPAPSWGSTTGGPPLSSEAGTATREGPEIWLTAEGLQVMDTLPPSATREGMRASLEPLRRDGSDGSCDHMAYDSPRVGLDARIPPPILRSFVEAARDAQLADLTLVAQRPVDTRSEAQLAAIEEVSPLLATLARTPYTQARVRIVGPSIERCLTAQGLYRRIRLGAAPQALEFPTESTDPLDSGTTPVERPSSGGMVRLALTDSSTSLALFEMAARLEQAGLQPTLLEPAHAQLDTLLHADDLNDFGALDLHEASRAEAQRSIPREVIRRVIRSHIDEVRLCYERELARAPELEGRVTLRLMIAASGGVVAAQVQATTLNNVAVEDCIVEASRGWVFPAPDDGGTVIVNYPFMLTASGS